MNRNRKYIYLVEGSCEEKLVNALKEKPSLIIQGKTHVFNIIHKVLPRNKLMQFDPGSVVILVFDTDTEETDILKKNITLIKSLKYKVDVLSVVQVLNFEDEIERSTDVKHAQELTQSAGVSDFKAAVNKLKVPDFRLTLNRHHFDIEKLWSKQPPDAFRFIEQDSGKIKEH